MGNLRLVDKPGRHGDFGKVLLPVEKIRYLSVINCCPLELAP